MKFAIKQFGQKVIGATQGWVTIGGNRFFARSSWEANIGAYLQFLKECGQILDWDHEPETFWFEGIKRGVVSYLPDFRVIDKDGTITFWEVKGYMDSRSATKIKRFNKYYPQYKLEVINKARYADISKHKGFIKCWGMLKAA
jgi:hypothetical protein